MGSIHNNESNENHECCPKPHQRRTLTIENSNHQDRYNVICNSKGAQKYSYARWNTRSQESQDAQSKSNICRSRNAPPHHGIWISSIKQQVYHNRHHDAAKSCTNWQNCLADIRQFTDRHFILYFQAHQKEENRHQNIVNDMRKRHFRMSITKPKRYLGMPKFVKPFMKCRVCHNQRNNSAKQHDTSGFCGGMSKLYDFMIPTLMAFCLFDENVGFVMMMLSHTRDLSFKTRAYQA